MNIAIFTDTFLPNINGIITSTVNIATELAEKGHKITIITPYVSRKQSSERPLHPNISVIRVKSIPTIIHKEFRATLPISPIILNKLAQRNIDIVHVETQWTIGLQGITFAKLFKLPLVGTFHTSIADPDYLKNIHLNFKLAENIIWNANNYFYNKCDLISCPSGIIKEELAERGIKKEIIHIPNGIRTSHFKKNINPDIRRKFVKDDEKLLISVGRVAVEKNIDHLLNITRKIVDTDDRIKLLIVGGGMYLNQAKENTKKLGLSENVIFTGYLSQEDVIKSGIYGAADLFVITSKTETGPMTVTEANASGVPAVGVNARNLPYMIKHDITGKIVEPEDTEGFKNAVLEILTNDALRATLSKNALKDAESFDISNIATKWEEIYANLINH